MTSPLKIAPSLLAADFACLGKEVKSVLDGGADELHIDVMDGHFVPNITMGPDWCGAVRRVAPESFLDVHLMIYNPYDYIERFIAAGADRVTIHVEATEDIRETLKFIRTCNKEAGIALSPETPAEMVEPYLSEVDLVLVMSVNPGFGGQAFIESSYDKLSYLSHIIRSNQLMKPTNPEEFIDLQVDGGIDEVTAPKCIQAGANHLVAGSYIFREEDKEKALQTLRGKHGS